MLIDKFVAILLLLYQTLSFDFKQLTVTPGVFNIGSTTTYSFYYQRYFNNGGSETDWSLIAVPAGSTITVTFPADYTLPTSPAPSCTSLIISSVTVTGYTCTTSGRTITVSGAITSNLNIYDIELNVANIINPVPAVLTGAFTGTIGIDNAVPQGTTGIQLVAASFDSCTVTFDTAFVNQTSTLVVTLDPKNQLDAASTILVDLPRRWTNDILTTSQLPITTSMTCVNYSSSVISSPTCVGNNVAFSVTASNVLGSATTSSFAFGIRQLVSPPTLQPSDAIIITSYSGLNEVDTCTVYPSGLIANPFISLTITSVETMTVNTQVGLRFQLTLADVVNDFDDIQIIYPSEITPTFVNVSSGIALYNTSQCTVTGQTLTIVHRRLGRVYARSSVYTFTTYKVKAPPSTKTTNAITVKIIRNGFDKMVSTRTMQAVTSLLTGAAAATLTTVNQVTTYRINVTTIDTLTSTGMVKIVFPSTITLTITSGCATLVGTSVRSSPTCTYDSTTNSVLISNLGSSTASIPAQTLRFTISGVQNAPSVNPSGVFTAYTYYTSDTSDLVSQGTIAGVTASLDVIDPAGVSVRPSSYVVSDTLVTYTLNFLVGNRIPQFGYAQITIPTGITLNVGSVSSYCKLSINSGSFFTTACSGVTLGGGYYVNFTNIAAGSALVVGTNVSLRIQTLLTNPADTSIVSSFTVKTYHSDGYGIEQLTSGISVQMTTPSTMTSMLTSRSSQLNSDAATTYTFRLRQTPPLPASSKLIIGFPSSLVITGAIGCTTLNGTTAACSQSGSNIEVQIDSLFSSGSQFGAIISNIGNPPSFAPFTSPFTFQTKSSNNILSYASGSETSTLQTSLPSAFTSPSSSFSSRIYGQATNLQITLTPSARLIPSYLLVTIPSSFTVSTLSCTSGTCVSTGSSNVIRVNGITSISQLSFTISGITAPIAATTDTVIVNSFDSNNYKIDENTATFTFSTVCTMPCRTCTSTPTVCQSCYTNTAISTFNYYYSTNNRCYDTCPSGTYSDSTSGLRCLDCNSNCLTCTVTSTNCTSCVPTSNFTYLYVVTSTGTCRSSCPNTHYPDTTTTPVQCVLCVTPCSTCTSSTQCTACVSGYYFYNNTCSLTCPSGTTIPNNSTNTCDACSSQCLTCSGTINTCVTCSGSAANYLGTCVSVCPGTLVIYNGNCSSCSTACGTCSINFDNCTSCNTSSALPYLYNRTCTNDCPVFYYESLADGLCKLCSTLNLGCDNCTSVSTCGTCNWDQGYVFLSQRCYLTTPNGYYNDTGYALPCNTTTDCATCFNFAYNCTACVSLNLQGNLCVATCTPGFVGVNKVCVACTSNCRTCSFLQSNCTSCLTNLTPQVFLNNFQCNTTCPDYTYQNYTTNQCTSCSSPCQKCSSQTLCITCAVGYFLSNNNSCDVTCPYGYLGINRICVRCSASSGCDSCNQSLTLCLTCLPTYYLVSSTSSCVTTCPTSLYPNTASGTCTGCVTPCATCSVTASNCTSCSTGNLLNYTCVSNCPDGYYLLNSQCLACNVNCSTCTSASVCTRCVFGLYLYSGNCVSTCPTNFPVTTTGNCTDCTDTNCIICDSLDQCSQCNFPTLLLSGHCLTSCPTDYVSNGTHCNYSPATNTTDATNVTLNETLSSTNLFPVPFTIAATFMGIACIMSKFQHSYTFISGALYSLWSLLQWGSLGVGAFLYYQSYQSKLTFTSDYIEAFVFAGAVAFMYFLNILALLTQNCYLRGDGAFKRWLEKEGSNSCFYTFSSLVGLFVTHKFKNIIFCKLFGFDIFKAKLDNIQTFKIFNILSFLSFIPSGAILFATSYMIYKHHTSDQQLMAYIDIIVLTTVCVILSILNSRKGDDFFEQKDEDGIIINKRIIQSDSIMQEAIVPFMAAEQGYQQRGNMGKKEYQTQRKFKSYMETESLSEEPSYQYLQPPKSVHNISIQAAPVLQDFSKIDFYNDEQLSDISMFRKADKSVNMTKQLNFNQVSIQNDLNIFDQKQVSIQNNPAQEDISIQHQLDVRDVSLQNAVNQDDQGIQMSRHDEDHSIQVGVLVNNASVQYSAKPVFENISEDYIDEDDDNNPNTTQNNNNQFSTDQKPAQNPQALKAELQLDVDEKLRRRQQERQMQREQQIAKKKEEMIRKFHEEQEKKNMLQKQKKQQRNDQFDKVNQMYNNQISRADGSSLMDSDANIMVHFQNKPKKDIKQANQSEGDKRQRAQSAKTEKQFIQMLQNNQPNLDGQSSMSFNVTRDLEQGNTHKNNQRGPVKNVVYEEQDKFVDSAGEDMEMEQPQNRRNQVYILQNDTGEQIPSGISKSRSTNFLSTNGRRPPLPNRTNSKNLLDDTSNMDITANDNQYQEIVHHPIKSVAKNNFPKNHVKQEDLEYVERTNLNKFLDRKKNNPVSAHQFSSSNNNHNRIQQVESDQFPRDRDARQNPLPLPKIERLKSQESNHSNDNSERLYKMNTRKALLEDRKLEFEDEQKIFDFNSEQDQYNSNSKLPKVQNSGSRLKNVKSLNKLPERDTSYERPVHREILGRQRYADRTQKFLEKQYRKAENTKKKIEQMQVMLERPNINSSKGYLKQTHSSIDKKKKSDLEKVYMNNPFEKKS